MDRPTRRLFVAVVLLGLSLAVAASVVSANELEDPDPEGNLTSEPATLSVTAVRDGTENASVAFYWNGNHVDTKYTDDEFGLNQLRGTISTSNSFTVVGGANNYTVVMSDVDSADTARLETTVRSPSTLTIRNETNPDDVLDSGNITINLRWFGDEAIYTNSTTSGTIDMTGLPVTDFITEVSANESYYDRTVYINSIFEQRDVYLLNTSVDEVEARFSIEDYTGNFPQRTVIKIDKPINQSSQTSWKNIYGDREGVEGVTAILEKGERYRIRLRSPSNHVQDMGPYRADVSEEITIQPGSAAVEIGEYVDGYAYGANIEDRTLHLSYHDPENKTDSLKIWAHEKNNVSNQLHLGQLGNLTFSDLGQVDTTWALTTNESRKTWVVHWEIDREGQDTFNQTLEVEKNPSLAFDMDAEWKQIAGIGALFLFGGMFSVLNTGAGAIMVALIGGLLWWTGWLVGATSAAAVTIYLFVAILYNIYIKGGP